MKTAAPLSPASDPNWMLLFIDSDRNPATGWQGYDFMIGKSASAAGHTQAYRFQNGDFQPAFEATIAYRGAELELGMKKADLGVDAAPQLDFHWADNIQQFGKISEFFLSGDSAPDRRFNFRYVGLAAAVGGAGAGGASAGSTGSGGLGGASGAAGASAMGGVGGGASGASGTAASKTASGGAAPSTSSCGCALPRRVPNGSTAFSALGMVALAATRARRRLQKKTPRSE